jgi:poly(hydroxyalkanoate) depolymerase family esterase
VSATHRATRDSWLAISLAMGLALPGAARGQMHTPVNGEFIEGRFESRFGARRYKLFIPTRPAPDSGRPLVVMLHGCTQNADDIARGTRLNERAAIALPGALVLYPEQSASDNPQKCWNWFDKAHQVREAGEPALLAELVSSIVGRYGAHRREVFVAGISAGGAMAVNLVVAYPELFAGAAVHSGIPYGAAATVMQALPVMRNGPSDTLVLRPIEVPLLVMHGESDAVVNPRNGGALAAQWRSAVERSLHEPLVAQEAEARSTDGRVFRRVAYTSSTLPVRPFLEWWTVRELGHAWSGGSKDGTFTDERGPDATAAILDFFARNDAYLQLRELSRRTP